MPNSSSSSVGGTQSNPGAATSIAMMELSRTPRGPSGANFFELPGRVRESFATRLEDAFVRLPSSGTPATSLATSGTQSNQITKNAARASSAASAATGPVHRGEPESAESVVNAGDEGMVTAAEASEQARASRAAEQAERKFRAGFLRQMLAPLTEELVSSDSTTGAVGSGMDTYRFFLEEALSTHLEKRWPLPEFGFASGGEKAATHRGEGLPVLSSESGAGFSRLPVSATAAAGSLPVSVNAALSAAPPPKTPLPKIADPDSGESSLLQSIREAARNASLPDTLVRAVVDVESAGDSRAVSPAGAQGLMQLMPGTAAELGVENPFDPKQNLAGGARYLAEQLDRFDGDLSLALAAYNAGPGAVKRHGGIPPYRETQNYVQRVLARKAQYDAEAVRPDTRATNPNQAGNVTQAEDLTQAVKLTASR